MEIEIERQLWFWNISHRSCATSFAPRLCHLTHLALESVCSLTGGWVIGFCRWRDVPALVRRDVLFALGTKREGFEISMLAD